LEERRRLKVLVVEDSALIRARLEEMVAEIPGVEIIGEAGNGIEALTLIQRLSPDIVILDVRMPRCNGVKVLKSIRKKGRYPIVIVLTNYPSYRQRCMEAGASFFFNKSTEFEKVLEVIQRLVESKQSGE
jgi:DNA-binding NarL/FixJ family response regulator